MPRSNIKRIVRPILSCFVLAGLLLSLILVAPDARAAPAAPQAALAPNYAWHTFYGSSGGESGWDIAVDQDGNVYFVSSCEPGFLGDGGQPPLHAYSGGWDIVVVKLSSNGVYQWHTFLGSGSMDMGEGISVDDAGNVYIVGSSNSGWYGNDFINPLHAHSGGSYNLVVVKLNQDGAYQWHTFYGLNGLGAVYTYGEDIALDESGDPVIVSNTNAAWKGDQGVDPLHPFNDEGEFALLKLTSDGVYQWHTFYGSQVQDSSWNLTVDGSGNVWLSGTSEASWMGDNNAAPRHSYAGDQEIVILKLSADGGYLWHTFYGSESWDNANGISSDGQGGVILTGVSSEAWLAGSVAPRHAYSGDSDIFVMRLNGDGIYQWHTFYGSAAGDTGSDVLLDKQHNVYVLGSSSITWQGDNHTPPVHPANTEDAVILKLTASGAYLWHTFYGGSQGDSGHNIALDSVGNLLILGSSSASWLGDAGTQPIHPFAPNDDDNFVLKLAGGQTYLPLLQR